MATRENVAADSLRLNAQAAARLAREGGDARTAYTALLRHYSLDPDRPGLRAEVLRYAVIVGDRTRATALAEALWADGSRSLEIRAILIANAVQRADWKRVRDLSDSANDKVRVASSLLGDVIGGWTDVALRVRDPGAALRAGIAGARDASLERLSAAAVLLAAGQGSDVVAPLLDGVRFSDPAARLLGRRLVPQLQSRGDTAAAGALIARMDAAQPLSRDEEELMRALPGKVTAAQGIASWMSLLAASTDSPVASNRRAAMAFARAAAWLAPRDAGIKLVLAATLDKEDQAPLALALFDDDAGGASQPTAVTMRRAELLADTGDIDAALAIARPLAARADATLDMQLRMLTLLRTAKQDAEVAALLDRLIADDGGVVAALPVLAARLRIARAEIHLASKDWAAAKPLLDQAIALQPADASILNFAGYSAIEARRDIEASFALIERAWRLDPNNAAITDSLGWAHFLQGQNDRAVALLEAAAAAAPDNAIINEHLGDALWRAGRRFEARFAWAAAAITAEGDTMLTRLKAKEQSGLTAALIAP